MVANENLKAQEAYGTDIAIPPNGEGLVSEKNVDPSVTHALEEAPISISPADSKRVLRKLDLCLMPMMCLVVLFQFLDKTSLNYANLLGVQEDLNIAGSQFSWLGSILYFGYLVASPVHGYFLQHVDLSRYAATNVLLWGITLLCHSATFNFGSLATARFFLGVLEGSITPSFILLTGRFYTRREQIPRTAIWFSMNGWAQMLGGLIAFGLLSRDESPNGIELWQELFLILGALTFTLGVVLFFCMPSSPATTKYLTPEERTIAVERIRENKTGINDPHFKMEQLWEALRDPRLYLFVLTICCGNIVNGCLTFASAIIKGFGFSQERTALLGMTTGAAEIVAVALGIAVAALTKTRMYPGIGSQMIAVLGAGLMVGLPASNQVGRMSGYAVLFFYPVVSPFVYSWLSSCIGGSSKKIVFNVVVQLAYCTGNIIGPQTYREKDAPLYTPAKVTMIIMLCLVASCMAAIGLLHKYWNNKRDKAEEFGQDEFEGIEFSDMTDQQIRSFRYPL